LKKICFIVDTQITANAFLLNHLKELSLSYQVSICLNKSLYPLSLEFEDHGVRIIDIPIERKFSFSSDLLTLLKLLFILRAEKFDSVHTLTSKAGLVGMFAAYVCSVPIRLHTFTGQIWINDHGAKKWLFKNMDRAIAFLATKVFCDSASQSKFLYDEGVVKGDLVSVIGFGSISGVDLDRFKSDEYASQEMRYKFGATSNDCIFLFVGRLCSDKGIFDLLSAFTLLSSIHPEAMLWIVGPDEEDIQRRCLARFPDFFSRIKWIGPTSRPENYMKAVDIFV